MHQTKIFDNAWDVDRRLSELLLNRDIIHASVRRGVSAHALCTPNHPISFPGTSLWAEAMAALRELTAPLGFDKSDVGGQPVAIHPSGELAFTVATGDERTGVSEDSKSPATRSSKGPRTIEAIEQNQLYLIPEVEADHKDRIKQKQREERARKNTWFLLIFFDPKHMVCRCELSLPNHMDEKNHIDGWAQRIIIGDIPFGDGSRVNLDGSGGPPMNDEITVEVKRR